MSKDYLTETENALDRNDQDLAKYVAPSVLPVVKGLIQERIGIVCGYNAAKERGNCEELKADLIKILTAFDSFADDMFDIGAMDSNGYDKDTENLISRMKLKYIEK